MKSWNAWLFIEGATWRSTSFNGATTMKSWNANASTPRKRPTRPLQWSHDDEVVECSIAIAFDSARGPCFNGATTMKSWNASRRSTPRGE